MRTATALLAGLVVGCSGGESPPPGQAQETAPSDSVPQAALEGQDRRFQGMMVYFADAPRFTDCVTGASAVMAQEGDYPAAERAYLDAGAQGAPLLVSFQGRVVRRSGMEGDEVDAVVVTEFGEAVPGQGCGGEPVVAPLEGTEWHLVALPGASEVLADAGATLVLERDGGRSSGSTGCSRFSGGYDLQGGQLRVGVTAVTRMACSEALARVEADYLEALRVAGGYRFAGAFLELLGEAGPVARFAEPD